MFRINNSLNLVNQLVSNKNVNVFLNQTLAEAHNNRPWTGTSNIPLESNHQTVRTHTSTSLSIEVHRDTWKFHSSLSNVFNDPVDRAANAPDDRAFNCVMPFKHLCFAQTYYYCRSNYRFYIENNTVRSGECKLFKRFAKQFNE